MTAPIRCPYHPDVLLLVRNRHIPDAHGQWWGKQVKACPIPHCGFEAHYADAVLLSAEEAAARGLLPLPALRPLPDEEGEGAG